jgi:hypothetical protein
VLVIKADKASSGFGTATDQRLVSAFCAFLGATNVPGYCLEYTQCLLAWLRANVEISVARSAQSGVEPMRFPIRTRY